MNVKRPGVRQASNDQFKKDQFKKAHRKTTALHDVLLGRLAG